MNYLIVGFGNIGHKRKEALGKKCLATIDPSPQSGADYQDARQIPDKIVKKCQAIVITVPRHTKLDLIKFWISQGKHILVEKPLVINQKEEKELQKLIKKNQVIIYTGYNHRFEPHIVKIKKLISSGFLGKLYSARLVYGFGNVRQIIGTWRESGLGAFEEIVPHLLDFSQFLFGYKTNDFKPLSLRQTEAKTFDYCLLTTVDFKVLMEASWIRWKNTFMIEAFGERGSLHMSGLCKWGESELIIRKRIFPAGVPKEKRLIVKGPPDLTWIKDIKYFESIVKQKKNSLHSDLAISEALTKILQQYLPSLSVKQAYKLLRGQE